MYDELIRPSSSSEPLKLILHSFKEDATNTGILKGSKMGALILRSAYLKASHVPSCDDELPDIDWENFDISEWLDTIVRVADVLPVVAGTSEATYAQMLKQLESLGCITWKQIQADDALRQQHACVSRSFDSVGRWSGLEKPEERFIKCGEARLTPILTEILGSQSRKEASKKQSQSHASVDELAIEETKAYSQKMSKWRRKTVDCVSDKLWWETVGNMHQVRAPLSHFSNFLKKRGPENKKTWRSSHIAQLVLGRALEFRQEFSDQWRKIVDSWDGTVDDNDQDAQFARNFAKIVEHLLRYPFLLLELARHPPHVFCSDRQQRAKKILDSSEDALECNTRKIRALFARDLAFCASTGYGTWKLFVDTEDRFQPVGGPRAGCPTLATANAAQREIDPDLFPPVTAGKDGQLEPVPGSWCELTRLSRLNKQSCAALDKLAEKPFIDQATTTTTKPEPASDDPDLVEYIRNEMRHHTTKDEASSGSDSDDDDGVMETVNGFLEQFEEKHCGSGEATDEASLAQAATRHQFDEPTEVLAEDDQSWGEAQKTEMMEAEQRRMEVELVSSALKTGVPMSKGEEFLAVANAQMAVPWTN
ncbi:unnamed protein product [Durusdinium trenchii]|uniref:Uncharacterized protein n=1 Tax=Durusdinium trenchii TaxID=1381693 RepID=A0ABP0LMW7_9DINO